MTRRRIRERPRPRHRAGALGRQVARPTAPVVPRSPPTHPPLTTALDFLDRERTIAAPGYNRWLVPPAALAIHLAIGEVYAFSVFNLPLTRLIGHTESAPEDWKLSTLG